MKSKVIRLIYLLSLVLMLSCEEFPLEGEHFVELSEEPTTEVFLNLFDMPDTLVLVKNTQIAYSFDLSSTAAFAVYLVFNDKPYYLSSTSRGVFTIPYNFFAKEIVKFEFVVVTTTSTGSLADYYKRELLLWSLQRTLIFDNTPTVKLEFTIAEERNGSIYLEWPQYPHINLNLYRIVRSWKPDPNRQAYLSFFDLDLKDTHITDTIFVGGEISYKIVTRNNYDSQKESSEVFFTGTPATINSFKTINKDTIELTWNKPHFVANAVGYKVSVAVNNYEYFSEGVLDTVTRITGLEFGYPTQVTLTTLSRDPTKNLSRDANVYLGEKLGGVNKLIDDPERDRSFILNSPKLVKFENEQRDTTLLNFSNTGPTFLSEDGNTLFLTSSNTIFKVDASTLTLIETFPYTINKTMYDIKATDNTIYICYAINSSSSGIIIYNQLTKSVVQNFIPSVPRDMRKLFISPGNQYLMEAGKKIFLNGINSDGTLVEIKEYDIQETHTIEECFVKFTSDVEAIVTYRTNYNALRKLFFKVPELIPTSGIVTLKSNNTDVRIDYPNKLFGYYYSLSTPRLYDIKDLETGNLIKRIKVNDFNAYNIRLYGRYVQNNSYLYKY